MSVTARIIPARAGFTSPGRDYLEKEMDHPRSRGVYAFFSVGFACGLGSSPLARGLPVAGAETGHRRRIIPARAGFTPSFILIPCMGRDHPRSRGVYRRESRHPRRIVRIIPARAGFTNPHQNKTRPDQDHPRSRGVYRGG